MNQRMNKLIFALCGLGLAFSATAANPRADISANPKKSGGIYYAYPVSGDSLAPIPAGYEPVYISHYGRHGSRWMINERIFPIILNTLAAQRAEGNTTAVADELEAIVRRSMAHTHGHAGELSALGKRQHRDIAQRLQRRFPSLMKGQGKVIARSSQVPRCIESMYAFTGALRLGAPSLRVENHATPGDMDFIAYSTPEAQEIGRDSSDWAKSFIPQRDSLWTSAATAAKIFKDATKVGNLPRFMHSVHDVAISFQDVEGIDADLYSLFEIEDLYNHWKSSNYMAYVRNANSPLSGKIGAQSARSLLDNIIAQADAALAGNGVTADLRFGHDNNLIRLLALMLLDGCNDAAEGLDAVTDAWQNYNVSPMGANLQLIFARNAEDNVLVAVRHNEQPTGIEGLHQVAPGWYNWSDVRMVWASAVNPVAALADRLFHGQSARFVFQQVESPEDFFEISSAFGKPLIRGNNYVNIAAGLNWYLKYYAGVHMSWNNLSGAKLPEVLPLPIATEKRTTDAVVRYYLNYCTHSYSMAFWNWERWQQEIDWMALHGINMPLVIAGTDAVWRNTLLRLGYTKDEADAFVAGPAFQAWWLMNNLEGWGGPNTEKWYADRIELQRKIVDRMHELGMEPVLPGYSGMVPHDADTRLGMEISGKGLWNGFVRPAFLKTTDPQFDKIADIYYDELTKVNGPAKYYSMDPFHEGGSTEGVDLTEAGSIIARAMKRANPDAVWVIQGWNENPRAELLAGVPKGDIVVLDLASEIKPNWGDPESPSLTKRADGYGLHDWIWCMVLNFGGNVGMHGRMDNVIDGYYKARASHWAPNLKGYGLTPEGIENNPVMYELASELIWRPERFSKEQWLKSYARARYGAANSNIDKAWRILGSTIYNAPWGNMQQGTTESVFCARPSDNVWQVSSWSRMAPYYEPSAIITAARAFAKAAPKFKNNANYVYDLVDITRQAIAEKGRIVYTKMQKALAAGKADEFERLGNEFLGLIRDQEALLATMPDFSVQTWIDNARSIAPTPAEADNMERNARLLITTWGPRVASEEGGLRDYAHREWAGLLGQLYLTRWQTWIEAQTETLRSGKLAPEIDFYEIDAAWVNSRTRHATNSADPVETALRVMP